ncbi:MAG: hypothetical protein SOZ94_11455 [Prevotella sp.]|nr:hypothetical protein [Prevotella sp.]
MSKFADYYTYSPLAAMRTGRQPHALSAESMRRCPAPNALSAGGMRRCPVPQCPFSRRHETLPSPNALSAGGMRRCQPHGRFKERRGARHKGK